MNHSLSISTPPTSFFCQLDYEDPSQRNGFELDIRVFDGKFYATTKIRIEIEDINDSAPIITGPKQTSILENVERKELVAEFVATDLDENDFIE
uniref:Cadherin domain-containing protein n=1 Tax=Panagrolaimus sp. PS1159 TaxID=55785 RepID=A0AC35FWD7_9BILA